MIGSAISATFDKAAQTYSLTLYDHPFVIRKSVVDQLRKGGDEALPKTGAVAYPDRGSYPGDWVIDDKPGKKPPTPNYPARQTVRDLLAATAGVSVS